MDDASFGAFSSHSVFYVPDEDKTNTSAQWILTVNRRIQTIDNNLFPMSSRANERTSQRRGANKRASAAEECASEASRTKQANK